MSESKPRDLFFAINAIWDRANPVEGSYGMFQERPIAYMMTSHVPPEEAPILGRQFAAGPKLLEACKAQEEAEEHHSNCEECDDGSLCDTGTDLYRKAKTLRQAAIAKAEDRA